MPLVFSSGPAGAMVVVLVAVVVVEPELPTTVVLVLVLVVAVLVVVVAACVVVVSNTCSGAPAIGASPLKIARICCMLSPLMRGTSTAAPLIVSPTASIW